MVRIHPWLKSNMEDLRDAVLHHDWDGLLIVDGMEGSGKSTLAQQVAAVLDPEFHISKIVFTAEQFVKQVKIAKKGDCIVWDETDFQSSNVAMQQQKLLRRFLQVVRERNLFLILVAPYIFDLDKYIAVARSRCLLHVFTQGFTRGQFEFYGYNSKRVLYFLGKQRYWDYSVVKQDWKNPGWFEQGYMVDRADYLAKKREATARIASGDTDPFLARDRYILKSKEVFKVSDEKLGEVFNLSKQRIGQIISRQASKENK